MTQLTSDIAVTVDGRAASGRFVLVCEHAANAFPDRWGALGLSDAQRLAHIAWDPGALGLAQALAQELDAGLVHANSSRLIYDLNRPPHSAAAMPARSEVHEIPGNRDISAEDRWERTRALYLPFQGALRGEIARRLAFGQRPAIVTVHSFTPVYNGVARAVELGVIHDAAANLAEAVVTEARAQTDLDVRLNEPYSAADEVTHTLALQATPYGLPNVMLELRNDLIATAEAQTAMAARLAPVLRAALARIEEAR